MIVEQELEERGDELTLLNHINTDDEERINWDCAQKCTGFIRDEKNHAIARTVARIPIEEAAMLEAMCDIDYLSFSRNNTMDEAKEFIKCVDAIYDQFLVK